MVGDWLKKLFQSPKPTWSLDDPTPRLKEAPYTFFVPSPERIALLQPKDLVKLIFRSAVPRENWDAEKMWVEVTDVHGDNFFGMLANDPFDIPQLKAGYRIEFQKRNIIDLELANPERLTHRQLRSLPPESREYWDRCLVDECVLNGSVPVGYIYREVPEELGPNARFNANAFRVGANENLVRFVDDRKYRDSGWRIRGYVNHSDFIDGEPKFVALGAVLNKDDSWLHLIDEPVGSAFTRDFSRNEFVRDQT